MRVVFGAILSLAVLGGFALMGHDTARPGPEGYLILALSWTPSWCAGEGDARGDTRCATGSGAGWLVHGLWPQHEGGGWPEYCDTPYPAASRTQTAAMTDIMGSSGLAWHQWRKHGTCSGLDAETYFERTRAAFAALALPDAPGQDRPTRPEQLLARVQQANPGLQDDMAIVTCRAGLVQELRLCLTHDLRYRACDGDVLARMCRSESVVKPALR